MVFAQGLQDGGLGHLYELVVDVQELVVLLLRDDTLFQSLLGRKDDILFGKVEGFLCVVAHLAGIGCEKDDFALVDKAFQLCAEVRNLYQCPCTVVA